MGHFESSELNKGLVQDLSSSKTPNGIIEFALNAVVNDIEGGISSRHTEGGCDKQLESEYVIDGIEYRHVGHIDMTPNKKILFLYNPNAEIIASFIQGVVTVIRKFVSTERFGIHDKYPIQGQGHIRRGIEEVIYWCDGFNPDRSLNLSKLYLYENNLGVFQPNLTLFNQIFSIPNIELSRELDSGGAFELGSYRLAFQYEDSLGNSTDVFFISNPIQVARDNTFAFETQIAGGYNALSDNFTTSTLAYDRVSKSFVFDITNIDINYNILRIYAVSYTDGNATPTGVYIIDEIPIAQRTQFEYSFQGIGANDVQVDLSEIINSLSRYKSCQYMLRIQNRLIKANLTENVYDWAKAQRYITENTKVKYVIDAIKTKDRRADNYSRAKGTFYHISLMRDEIASLGVSVIMADGQESPVLHIPGRRSLNFGNPYTVGSTVYTNTTGEENNLGFPGYNVGNKPAISSPTADFDKDTIVTGFDTEWLYGVPDGTIMERWRAFNTSTIDLLPELDHVSSGLFGYHECQTSYPLIRDSDGEIIYPHEIVLGNPVMGKVRHHRCPDVDLAPLVSSYGDLPYYGAKSPYGIMYNGNYELPTHTNYVYPMGVKIFDLILPPEISIDAIGFKFYIGNRKYNETIIDKGYSLGQAKQDANLFPAEIDKLMRLRGFPADQNSEQDSVLNPENFINFISPNTLQNRNLIANASYAKTSASHAFETTISDVTTGTAFESRRTIQATNNFKHHGGSSNIGIFGTGQRSDEVLDYARGIYAESQLTFLGATDTLIYDKGYQQKETILELRYEYSSQNTYNWLYPLNIVTPPNDPATFPASLETYMSYVSLKRTNDVYFDLEAIQYQPVDNNVYDITTTYSIPGTHCYIGTIWWFTGFANDYTTGVIYHSYSETGLFEGVFESTDNLNLRISGTDLDEFYYPYRPLNDASYYLTVGGTGFHPVASELIEMQYHFNPDYSILDSLNYRQGLNHNINWTSEERGRFPVRITWSEQSNDEEIKDGNLVFKALDYDDIYTGKGEIRFLAEKPNMLYAITDYSIYAKPTNAQEMDLSNSVAFLKSSSFLDIPETELYSTGSGYGGSQSRFAHINTEFGTAYVNQLTGEVYLLNKGVESLSSKGESLEHRTRLPSEFLKEFKHKTGFDYPYRDTTTREENGLGVKCYYDPIHKRLIISKVDYEFITLFGGVYDILTAAPNVIYWDVLGDRFIKNFVSVSPEGNTTDFRTKHLTVSYDFREQLWVSYHSWIPKVGFNDVHNMYTMPKDSNFWFKHVEHNYLSYYDETRFPFMIDFITPNMDRKQITQVYWWTKCGLWDATSKSYLNKDLETFNQIAIYNSQQTSGLLNLVVNQDNPFAWTSITTAQKTINRYNNIWRLNNIWDIRNVTTLTEPTTTENWNNLTYRGFLTNGITKGFIDKILNANSYNYNISKFNIGGIDNYETNVRLIYDNQNFNTKLTVDLVSIFKQDDLI